MFSFIYNQEYAKEKENTTLNSELPLLHTQPSPQLADHSSNEMRVRQLPSPAVGPLQGGPGGPEVMVYGLRSTPRPS